MKNILLIQSSPRALESYSQKVADSVVSNLVHPEIRTVRGTFRPAGVREAKRYFAQKTFN